MDDGSDDEGPAILEALAAAREDIRVITMDRNSGQSAALAAGIQRASGDVIVTLDADLQNDPADVPALLAYYGEYQMINGWRHHRQDR